MQAIRPSRERLLEFDKSNQEYREFDDANNPHESEDDEKNMKRSYCTSYPRFHPNVRVENVKWLAVLKFIDEGRLREAFENYKIVNGLNMKIIKGDKLGFQAHCKGKGVSGGYGLLGAKICIPFKPIS